MLVMMRLGLARRRQAHGRNLASSRPSLRRVEGWDELLAGPMTPRGRASASCGPASKRIRDDQRRRQGTVNHGRRKRWRRYQPRRAGTAAGALLLPQGRHVGLHARGAGLHRGSPATSRKPAVGRSSASPQFDEEAREVHRQVRPRRPARRGRGRARSPTPSAPGSKSRCTAANIWAWSARPI